MEKVLTLIERVESGFTKLRAEDFSLDDASRSGRPAEVDSNQIETLIGNSEHFLYRRQPTCSKYLISS